MMQNGKARQRLRYKTRHMQESNRAAAMGETPPRGGDEDPTKCEHPIPFTGAKLDTNNIIFEAKVFREFHTGM